MLKIRVIKENASTSLFTSRQTVKIESYEGLFPLLMEKNAFRLTVQRRVLSAVCKEVLSVGVNTRELCFKGENKHTHHIIRHFMHRTAKIMPCCCAAYCWGSDSMPMFAVGQKQRALYTVGWWHSARTDLSHSGKVLMDTGTQYNYICNCGAFYPTGEWVVFIVCPLHCLNTLCIMLQFSISYVFSISSSP